MKFVFVVFLFSISSVFAGNGTRHLPPSERYLPVVKQIVKFTEFLQTELIEIQRQRQQKQIPFDAFVHTLRMDLAQAEILSEWGEELLSGKASGDTILQKLLIDRFGLILRTEERMYGDKPADLYASLKGLISDECIDVRLKSYVITRFQVMGLIAKKLFEVLDLDELSEKTTDLIRASVSLWPLFKGETRSLGNPWFEAGLFAKLDAYYEDVDQGLVKPTYLPVVSNSGSPELKRISTFVNLALLRIHNGEESPTWESRKYKVDSEVFKSHFNYKQTFIPFLGLGVKGRPASEKHQHGIMGKANDYQAGLWAEPLPDPGFLHPQKDSTQFVPVLLGATFFETFPFEELEIEEEEKKEEKEVAPLVVPAAAAILESIKESVPVFEKKASPASKSKETKTKEHIVASGIRKFHAHMPPSDYAELNLSSSKQKLVDDFFDSKKLNTMTYGKFRTLWLHLGGRIEADHGSSHNLLIGPRGEALFGIYAHGDSQTYSPKTIKYLRTALWHIGCRPQE